MLIRSLLDVSQQRLCLFSGFVGRQPPMLADDNPVRSTILPGLRDIGLQASGVDDVAKLIYFVVPSDIAVFSARNRPSISRFVASPLDLSEKHSVSILQLTRGTSRKQGQVVGHCDVSKV
jgi:hypothetical protein